MERLHHFRLLALTGALLAISGTFAPARAQDPDDLKRGVARISLMNGDVSVRRGDSGDWVAGVINAPLLAGDQVATGPNSRTEVQFDASNLLRLGANGEFRLSQLEYGRYQMDLAHGVMTYRMLRTSDPNVEIDTPTLSVRPTRQGSFRISVNDAGETEVTARNGDVEVFTPRGSQWVRSGQTLMARGNGNDAEFQIVPAGGMDEWDRWCDSRDQNLMNSVSSRYVGPGVYGAEDLDTAGTWTTVPEYGNVWQPTAVAADWAPYQSGRWAWEDWYGWTWVSYDPWGWAPYHYGRWFHHDRLGWCWYPGLITARHYWSPALVGFIGFGGGGGVGFGFGNVGWVPLAPYEVFHPWWGRGYYGNRGFNRNINITNVNITNVYRNSRARNGISAVAFNDFQSGRFNNINRTSGDRIREVGAIRGQLPFTGSAAHERFSDRQARVTPRAIDNTRFFRTQQPTPVQRGGFGAGGRQTDAGTFRNQQNGNPADRGSVQRGGFGGQQNAQNQPNRNASSPQGGTEGGGWRRFGSPSNQPGAGQGSQPQTNRNNYGTGLAQRGGDRPSASPQVSQPAAPRNENRGGWQRFGSPAGGNAGGSQAGRGNAAPEQRQAPAVPRQEFRSSPYNDRPNSGGGSAARQESLRIAPPVVRERPSYNDTRRQNAPSYNAPSYNAPRQQSAPSYNAPRQSAPSYSAPRQQSAPSYSAPRQSAPAPRGNSGGGNSGGGNNSAPRGNSGGGHGNRGR